MSLYFVTDQKAPNGLVREEVNRILAPQPFEHGPERVVLEERGVRAIERGDRNLADVRLLRTGIEHGSAHDVASLWRIA